MNDIQSNHVRMIRATADYCGLPGVVSATGSMTAFGPLVANTNSKLVLIDGYDMIAKGNSKGVTADTQLIRDTMQAIAIKCARGTFAYANSVHNNTLKAKVDFTLAKLEKMKMDEVDDICEQIATETTANIGAVGAYGVLAGDPATLMAAVVLYRAAISKTRQSIISKTGAIAQIDDLTTIVIRDNFKGLMDPMMDTLLGTADDVVRGYKQARVILNLGHTDGKIRGECRDEDDNTLNGVLFTVKEAGTQNIVGQVTSANGGKFGVSDLLGDFDLSWEMAGRITVTETNVHVAAGKELRRKIRMMPV